MAIDSAHIDDLIAKYLAGEASHDEELQLRHWMDESDENKKYFGDIQFVHDKVIASHTYVKVNTEKAWEKVRGQMNHPTVVPIEPKPEKSINIWKWMQVAAIFLVILSSAVYLYNSIGKSAKVTTTYTITSTDTTVSRAIATNTSVYLNKHTTLQINQKKGERRKELTLKGEAFIQHAHTSDTTLIVKADETLIRDIGTSFNVKAYEGSTTIEVYVNEGEVAFYTDKQAGITIRKGETGIFDKTSRTFTKKANSNTNVISYKTKKFVFNNKKLADALAELNAVYSEPITVKNPNLANCSITVTFDNENASSIVDIMAETLGLKVEKTDTGYTLDGELCPSK